MLGSGLVSPHSDDIIIAPDDARKLMEKVEEQPRKVLFGLEKETFLTTNCLFTATPYMTDGRMEFGQAHVLLESEPGKGKTVLIYSLPKAVGGTHSIIAGHPELLPRDFIGGEIYNPRVGEFIQTPGPIFRNVVMFDEINRAPPQAQAPFLGAMEERQVVLPRTNLEEKTMDNVIHRLTPISDEEDAECVFWVLATMNPLEKGGSGTFPLGEAQLDRFAISLSLDYPPREEAKKIFAENVVDQRIEQVMELELVPVIARLIFETVRTPDETKEYIQRLVENSRPKHTTRRGERKYANKALQDFVDTFVSCGLSNRAYYMFQAVARTLAFRKGKVKIDVEDVKEVAPYVMRHRMYLTPESRVRGQGFIDEVVRNIIEETKAY